jgi:hypothetical protein
LDLKGTLCVKKGEQMKKRYIIMILLLLSFSFVACGGEQEEDLSVVIQNGPTS